MSGLIRTIPILAALAVAAAWLGAPVAAEPEGTPPPPAPAIEHDGPRDGFERDRDGRDFRDRRFDGRRGDRAIELTPERIKQMMIVVDAYTPTFAVELRALRESNPERYRQLLGRMMDHPRFNEAMKQLEKDPEGFALNARYMRVNVQIGHAMRKYHTADSETDKLAARDELRGLIDERLQIQLEKAEREVVELEQRIDTLRTEITERQTNREQLVDEKLEQMMAAEWRFDRRRGPEGDDDNGFDGPPRHRPDGFDGPPPPREPPADRPDQP